MCFNVFTLKTNLFTYKRSKGGGFAYKHARSSHLNVLFFLLGASSGAETVEQFFARLRKKYNWTDQGKMKEVVSELRKNEINTVKVLKELWEDVKGEIPLSIGMKKCLEVEIQKVW